MKKQEKKWRSPSLGRDMKMTIYGHSGTPVLAFPTRGQFSGQWEEHSMTEALSLQLEEGFNRLYCIDSIDRESFLNDGIEPSRRITRHIQYESFIMEEAVPFIREENSIDFLIVAGVDLGAYHALNLALKYPSSFGKVIAISGIYNIKRFMGSYYSDNVYYNNPIDYMPNLNKQNLLQQIHDLDIRIVSYTKDQRRSEAEHISSILHMKFVDHKLDIWDLDETDEWELWKQMLKTHII